MLFSEKLKELKNAAELSEAKLAKASGVPLGTLHTYVMGLRTPSFPAVVKIARALNVTCEAFADCEDVAGPAPVEPAKKPARRAAKPKK